MFSCKHPQRGLGRSPSRNRIWCISVLKSDIWWQQFHWFSWKSTDQILCSLHSKLQSLPKLPKTHNYKCGNETSWMLSIPYFTCGYACGGVAYVFLSPVNCWTGRLLEEDLQAMERNGESCQWPQPVEGTRHPIGEETWGTIGAIVLVRLSAQLG